MKRKRFIKLVMSYGVSRNNINKQCPNIIRVFESYANAYNTVNMMKQTLLHEAQDRNKKLGRGLRVPYIYNSYFGIVSHPALYPIISKRG